MREEKIVTNISKGTSLNNMASDEGLLLFKQISYFFVKNVSLFYLGEGEQPSMFYFFSLNSEFFFFLKSKQRCFGTIIGSL